MSSKVTNVFIGVGLVGLLLLVIGMAMGMRHQDAEWSKAYTAKQLELQTANAEVSRLTHELELAQLSMYSEEEVAQAMFIACMVPASKMDPNWQQGCTGLVGQMLIRDKIIPVELEDNPKFAEMWPQTWVRVMQAGGLKVQ